MYKVNDKLPDCIKDDHDFEFNGTLVTTCTHCGIVKEVGFSSEIKFVSIKENPANAKNKSN